METLEILKELKDNFYRWILPLTKKIIKNLIILREPVYIKKYRQIGEDIYQEELKGSINFSEKNQDLIYDKLHQLEYQTSYLIHFE